MLVVSKSSLLLGIIATSALLLGVLIGRPLTDVRQGQRVPVVTITPGSFKYRLAGEFDRDGLPVNAPLTRVRIGSPFKIMRTQVSAADYQRCVVARACPALGAAEPGGADIPATGVSWHDATAFAAWMSKMTGQRWRLPSDVEWALAAGSRFKDDAVRGDDAQDFAQRWIAKYEQDAAEAKPTTKAAQPFGFFGVNERGVADLAGNVWEWTNTCFERRRVDAAGRIVGQPSVNCGVKVIEGQHRSYMTDFIRDARAGGCSVGIPPANLGFRLIRDDPNFIDQMLFWMGF